MVDGRVRGVKVNAAVMVVAPPGISLGFGVWEDFLVLSVTLIIGL